ncbi:MAG: TatD family hydrolase, partial [archaeon]
LDIIAKYPDFVFLCSGLHNEFIKNIEEKIKKNFFKKIKKEKNKIVGIGETGLDYYWVQEEEWREKQRILFKETIELSKKLDKPLVVHIRGKENVASDALNILKEGKVKKVLLHLFGKRNFLKEVIEEGWYISMGPIIKTSKDYKKIARDFPLERILLETDSPWFGGSGRGTPLNIKIVCEEIAKIKKLEYKTVWERCGQNAIEFFRLLSK